MPGGPTPTVKKKSGYTELQKGLLQLCSLTVYLTRQRIPNSKGQAAFKCHCALRSPLHQVQHTHMSSDERLSRAPYLWESCIPHIDPGAGKEFSHSSYNPSSSERTLWTKLLIRGKLTQLGLVWKSRKHSDRCCLPTGFHIKGKWQWNRNTETKSRDWREGPEVKNTYCSYRAHKFSSQLTTTYNSSFGRSDAPSSLSGN